MRDAYRDMNAFEILKVADELLVNLLTLAHVRRQNGDFALLVALMDQIVCQLQRIHALVRVSLRRTIGYILFEMLMIDEVQRTGDADDRRPIQSGLMVKDGNVVEMMSQARDHRNRSVLHTQLNGWHFVLDQSFEERDVEIEVLGQCVDVRGWTQLNMIADQNQVFSFLSDCCDDM